MPKISKDMIEHIRAVIEYVEPNEQEHYESMVEEDPDYKQENHVYYHIQRVSQWLEQQEES